MPFPLDLVGDGEKIGRRRRNDVGREIGDELDLPLGEATARRDDGAAEGFGAVVEAEAAGEEPVAICVVELVARPAAGGTDRAGHDPRPDGEIAFAVADDRRPAGRAARGMNAGDLRRRHGEHSEGIVRRRSSLVVKESGDIGERFQIVRSDPRRVEGRPVVGDALIGPPERALQPFELQGTELVDRACF